MPPPPVKWGFPLSVKAGPLELVARMTRNDYVAGNEQGNMRKCQKGAVLFWLTTTGSVR